jgi:TatD DNase family protein
MTSVPRQVDFHCHLDLYPDLATAISVCEETRTATLAVTTTPRAFARNAKLAAGTQFVRVGLGLHPQLAAERWTELSLFDALLSQTRYVGEVGLDAGPRFCRSLERQTQVFRSILERCARERDKILSVHSVRTSTKVLDLVEELLSGSGCKVVLHWFTGTVAEAVRAASLGCYFSINQEMFRSDKAVAVIKTVPADRLLTETDGPFVQVGPKPISPGEVGQAVRLLASATGREPDAMSKLIVGNFAALVS